MNERIQALIEQATISRVITGPEVFTTPPIYFDKVKFAKLIIRECARVVDSKTDAFGYGVAELWCTGQDILEHFGVESSTN